MTRNSRVAVVGLGKMGLPIAKNLLKNGYEVEIWNRSDKKSVEAVAAGAKRVKELKELDSHIVLSVLPGMDPVMSILESGLKDSLKVGDIFVVMGTTSIKAMMDLQALLNESGVKAVDAPMSGGDTGAQNATMSIMVGADKESYDELLPIFEKIGRTIRLVGPVGSGQLTKAVNQVIVAVNMAGLGEAITFARRSGLDTSSVFDILAGGLAGSNVLNFGRAKIESNDFIPGGYAKNLVNDLSYAMEAAHNNQTSLPIAQLVASLYASLLEHGGGDSDISAIIKEFERISSAAN